MSILIFGSAKWAQPLQSLVFISSSQHFYSQKTVFKSLNYLTVLCFSIKYADLPAKQYELMN